MSTNIEEVFTVLVEYGDQRKPIDLTTNDDLVIIERKICDRYEFDIDQMKNLQIQWYDNDFQRYIDLDNIIWSKYIQNNNVQKPLKLVNKQYRQRFTISEGLLKRKVL